MKLLPMQHNIKTLLTVFSVSFSFFVLSAAVRADDVNGSRIYRQYCTVCHKTGLNGAPKYGSEEQWKKRVQQGKETVYKHALNGIRAMPAKGGYSSLSDAEVKAAVDYMVSRSGGWPEE